MGVIKLNGRDYGGSEDAVTDVQVNGTSVVDSVSKVAEITMPTKVSDLSNDAGFITSTVANLTNYYTKSETYTQNEVDALISAIVTLNLLVVQTLPVSDISQTTIYLVPKQTAGTQDVYDEYINLDGTSSGWEHIGSTEIDLSNYYTKSEVDALLADKADIADIPTVNDGTLTIQQNGTTVGTFSANQSGNTTINLAGGGGSSYTAGDGIDITNDEISVDTAFTEASTRANINSGDTLATIFGKIKKWFSDLASMFVSKTGDTMSGNLTIDLQNGTTTTEGVSYLSVGNSNGMGSANNSTGILRLFSDSGKRVNLYYKGSATADKNIAFPDSNGTVALTSDIPDISTKVSKSGDTMSGKLKIGTGNTAYGDNLELRDQNGTGLNWELAIKNEWNGLDVTNGWGTGIKLANGSDAETSKWAGIRSTAIAGYSNETALDLYASAGQRVRVTRDSLLPAGNNAYHLGSNDLKWADVYATTFHGNADSATQDGSGNNIVSTYATKNYVNSTFLRVVSVGMNGKRHLVIAIPRDRFGSYTRFVFMMYTVAGGAIRAYLCTLQTNNSVISGDHSLMAGTPFQIGAGIGEDTIDGVPCVIMSFDFGGNVYDYSYVLSTYDYLKALSR